MRPSTSKQRLLAHAGNPLDWSPLDRCLLLIALALLAPLLTGPTLLFLARGPLAPFINWPVLRLALLMDVALGLLWAALFAIGLRFRRRHDRSPLITHVITITWTAGLISGAYLVGLVTTPYLLLAAAGVALGALLLEGPIVHQSFAAGLLAALGLLVAETLGWIPHAPLFVRPPYGPEGAPVPMWQGAMAFQAVAGLVTLWLLSATVIARWQEREADFRRLSVTDELTGLANRRRFFDLLEAECNRARRTGHPVSVLMCDVDLFKRVNDAYGHRVGDEVLRDIAALLSEGVRTDVDTVGRIGGEEFAILLIETELDEAERVATRIAERARAHRYSAGGAAFAVTLSLGATSLHGERLDPDALIEAADALLYRAKRAGRDQVAAASFDELAAGDPRSGRSS